VISIGLIFLLIGLGLLYFSFSLYDKSWRYDEICKDQETCTLSIDIDKDLTDNIYIYYEIRNFYQNHRRYFKSKSSNQYFMPNELGSKETS